MSTNWLANLLTSVLVGCALALTAMVVRRELFPPRDGPDLAPRRIRGARSAAAVGRTIGTIGAPVSVVVFSDFQCPFCARAHPVLEAVQRRHPDRVRLVYRHFPLDPIHPYARPAAVASECAAEQGKFAQIAALLFAQQDSLGAKPWARFAAQAGVPDTAAFERCRTSARVMANVDRDAKAARDLGISVTPTLIVGDLLRPGAITEPELERLVSEAAPGRAPVASAPRTPPPRGGT